MSDVNDSDAQIIAMTVADSFNQEALSNHLIAPGMRPLDLGVLRPARKENGHI